MAGKITATLKAKRATDNTVIFEEAKDPQNPLSFSRFNGIYIHNRDLGELGFSPEKCRLKMTLEVVEAS